MRLLINDTCILVVGEPNLCEAFEGILLELKSWCATSYIKNIFFERPYIFLKTRDKLNATNKMLLNDNVTHMDRHMNPLLI